MTLENLLAIKRLQPHAPQRTSIVKLLEAASRNLDDAQLQSLSAENRFDAAYKCIMQCAMLGLWSCGYRTVTSQPGHHQTAIQCLGLTMAVAKDRIIVLDALRKQRNVSDYEGDSVSTAVLESCLDEAQRLLAHTRQWLRE
jgi:hypothetical protein